MAYILAPIPYFKCLIRREYTVNRTGRHGEYVPAIAYGVRSVRGHCLHFQCMLMEPTDGSPNDTGGASFLVPIEALVHKPCELPVMMTYIQPWDCFSSDFGVTTFDLLGAMYALPDRIPGQYQFTLDFTGSDLADDLEQHKFLHICHLEGGLIAALPNNRILWRDDAFWEVMDAEPDFQSLAGEYRAEGHQEIFKPGEVAAVITFQTPYSNIIGFKEGAE